MIIKVRSIHLFNLILKFCMFYLNQMLSKYVELSTGN